MCLVEWLTFAFWESNEVNMQLEEFVLQEKLALKKEKLMRNS